MTNYAVHQFVTYNTIDCERLRGELKKKLKQEGVEDKYTFSIIGAVLSATFLGFTNAYFIEEAARLHKNSFIEYYDLATHQSNEAYLHWNRQYAKDAQAALEQAQLKDNQALTTVSTILADRDNDNHIPLRTSIRQSLMQELQNRIRDRGDVIRQLDTRINPSRVRENQTEQPDDDHIL